MANMTSALEGRPSQVGDSTLGRALTQDTKSTYFVESGMESLSPGTSENSGSYAAGVKNWFKNDIKVSVSKLLSILPP